MIRVEQALEIILAQAVLSEAEAIVLELAPGRILRETVLADRDFPPFHRVSMDGIAISFSEFAGGRRRFPVEGQVPAGAPDLPLPHPAACLEVATGGVLPGRTDTVVPYEQVQISDNVAFVQTENVRLGQNIHRQGTDRRAGDTLLQPGTRIGAAEMAVLATVGKTHLLAGKRPRVAIVATGDELVPVGATPLPWQIRQSNPVALRTLLAPWAESVEVFHCADTAAGIEKTIRGILPACEVLVLSGGVSAGKRDLVPDMLRAANVKILLHQVAQRPGKPFLFGLGPANTAVFALPGNPVSAFLCACLYVAPWMKKSLGAPEPAAEWAFLAEPLVFKPDLTWFVPVALENKKGMLFAHPKPGRGSGDLANLHEAHAFLEIPRGREQFEAGEVFRILRF
ncbi:MAG: molybdopterin molybdotransferase MoeA [Lewinellaceae bacterium]|nr:molybdopterin molybdotransferase MoeA [Lewinellaceae bacterium]